MFNLKKALPRAIGSAIVLGAALSAHAQQTPTGNAEAAKSKISMCIGCHGIVDYRTAFPAVYHVPKLGGQSPTYIVSALKAYRSGERNHPSMVGIAKGLSDQDMADLGTYYGAPK